MAALWTSLLYVSRKFLEKYCMSDSQPKAALKSSAKRATCLATSYRFCSASTSTMRCRRELRLVIAYPASTISPTIIATVQTAPVRLAITFASTRLHQPESVPKGGLIPSTDSRKPLFPVQLDVYVVARRLCTKKQSRLPLT